MFHSHLQEPRWANINTMKGKEQQQEIVIAPPGCGKTYNLASRIYEAYTENELQVSDILCLTFTRQAAGEMRHKVRAIFKKKHRIYPLGFDDQIGTLHSYCVRNQEQDREQRRRLIDPDSSLGHKIANRLFKGSKDKSYKFSKVQYLSLRTKVEEEFPQLKIKVRNTGKGAVSISDVEKYHDIKKEEEAIDYGDILLDFYRGQLDCPQDYPKYKLILVDEAQDLNKLQLEIIKMLVSENGKVIYFADPGQSIYSFQGVDLKNLSELRKDAELAPTLSENRRSAPEIVNFINEYYRVRLQNQKELEGFPFSPQTSKLGSSGSGWLRLIYSCSRLQERKDIMHCIDDLPLEESCAILTRTNHSADEIVKHLTTQRKYFVYNPANEVHWRFLDALIAHLKVCYDPDNQENWTHLISSIRPSRSFISYGEKDTYSQMAALKILPSDLVRYSYGGLTYSFAESVKQGEDISSYDINLILSLYDRNKNNTEEITSDGTIKDVVRRLSRIRERQKMFFNRKSTRKAQSLLNKKYLPIYEMQRHTLMEVNGNPDNLWRIFEWLKSAMIKLSDAGLITKPKFGLWETIKKEVAHQMKNWIEEERTKGNKTWFEWKMAYINKLCDVLEELDKGQIVMLTDMPIHKVNVMTVHQAKGREFDNVIMYNATCVEYKRRLEEERILYVGITRAKKRIIISYSDSYKLNGDKKKSKHPPRKIDEDAERHIHWPVKILSRGKRYMRKYIKEQYIIEEMLSEMGVNYKYKTQIVDGEKTLNGLIVIGETQNRLHGTISRGDNGKITSVMLAV